jgi:hypothetical protein
MCWRLLTKFNSLKILNDVLNHNNNSSLFKLSNKGACIFFFIAAASTILCGLFIYSVFLSFFFKIFFSILDLLSGTLARNDIMVEM